MKKPEPPSHASTASEGRTPDPAPARRPPYEPPRIVKKRPVSRATLFSGTGPIAGGLTASG